MLKTSAMLFLFCFVCLFGFLFRMKNENIVLSLFIPLAIYDLINSLRQTFLQYLQPNASEEA